MFKKMAVAKATAYFLFFVSVFFTDFDTVLFFITIAAEKSVADTANSNSKLRCFIISSCEFEFLFPYPVKKLYIIKNKNIINYYNLFL